MVGFNFLYYYIFDILIKDDFIWFACPKKSVKEIFNFVIKKLIS